MRAERAVAPQGPDNERLTAPLSTFMDAEDLKRLGSLTVVMKPKKKSARTPQSRAAEVSVIAKAAAEEKNPSAADRRVNGLVKARQALAAKRAEAKEKGTRHVGKKAIPIASDVPKRGRPRTRGLFKPEMLPLAIKVLDLYRSKKLKKDDAVVLMNRVLGGATTVSLRGGRDESIEAFVRQNPGCLVRDIEDALDVSPSDISKLVTQKMLFALRSSAADRKAGVMRLYSMKDPVGRLVAKSHATLASDRSGVGGRRKRDLTEALVDARHGKSEGAGR